VALHHMEDDSVAGDRRALENHASLDDHCHYDHVVPAVDETSHLYHDDRAAHYPDLSFDHPGGSSEGT